MCFVKYCCIAAKLRSSRASSLQQRASSAKQPSFSRRQLFPNAATTARSVIGAGVYNNQILVAGGEGQDQRFLAAFKAVEAYDPDDSGLPQGPAGRFRSMLSLL